MTSTTESGLLGNYLGHTDSDGRLAENIMHFARTLRAAGLPVGPGRVLEAIRATRTVGLGHRQDFYWALHATLVNRREQRELFDQAFHIFWRNPRLLERAMAMLLPQLRGGEDSEDQVEMSRRLAEALAREGGGTDPGGEDAGEKIEIDAVMTYSDRELLQRMDFEKMSTEEVAKAKRLIAVMRLPIMAVPTRRFRPDAIGHRIDMRATLRAALRSPDSIPLRRRMPRRRHPPLVILCDISGSMSRYARIILHFMHAITNDRDRVYTFLFGTRLTNVTRHLRHKDIDVALEKVGQTVEDWSGGTRIGKCLAEFNNHWSRRVLGQGAVVLFISDGLDRDSGEGLAKEMERLHKSCRRLIWLNPLLRYADYEPRSIGARTIMPHVDEFRPAHNLDSLADLTRVLSQPGLRRLEAKSEWVDVLRQRLND
ncbi:MAG: VWA domain-containing protein [Dongiaceae bacterium]